MAASGVAVLVAIETSLDHSLWAGAAGYALLALIALKVLRCTAQEPDSVGSVALAGQVDGP